MGKSKELAVAFAHGKALKKAEKTGAVPPVEVAKALNLNKKPKGKKDKKCKPDPEPAPEVEITVPLDTKLPGGVTLGAYMKRNALSYQEAVRIYHAYTDFAEEEMNQLKRTREARKAEKNKRKEAETAAADELPEDEAEPVDKPSKAGKKKRKEAETAAAEELPGDAEPVDELSKASKKSKVKTSSKDCGDDPVRRQLKFEECDVQLMLKELGETPSPRKPRRVSTKRRLSDSERKVFPVPPAKTQKAHPSEEPEAEQPDPSEEPEAEQLDPSEEPEAEQPDPEKNGGSSSRKKAIQRQWSCASLSLGESQINRSMDLTTTPTSVGPSKSELMAGLEESVSQSGSQGKLMQYAKTAASYIHQLESKLASYNAIHDVRGSCGYTDELSEEILRMTEEHARDDAGDGWTKEEWDEWNEWDRLESEYLAKEGSDADPQSSACAPSSVSRPSPAGPTNSAAPAAPAAITDVPGKVNSSTHRAQYMRLTRQIERGMLGNFPHCKKLAEGSLKDRNDLFKSWLASGENLESCEARVRAERDDSVSGKKRYALVSVKDMTRVHGFSEKKVASIIARGGGIPDEDAPDVPEETRFWVLLEQEKVDTSTVRLQRSMDAGVRPSAKFADGILGSDPNPCMSGKGFTPLPSNPSLSGDVLRAYDDYNKSLAAAASDNRSVAGRSGCSRGSRGSRRQAAVVEKRPLLEQHFKDEKEKHLKWSNELRKEIQGFPCLLLEMPASSPLIPELKKHQAALTKLAKQFKDAKTNEEMDCLCQRIADEVEALKMTRGQAKGLISELKKQGAIS